MQNLSVISADKLYADDAKKNHSTLKLHALKDISGSSWTDQHTHTHTHRYFKM